MKKLDMKNQIIYDEEKKKRYLLKVIFKDECFENSVVKTNNIQVLKQVDIAEVVSV